jgi:hypothetical protein
MGVCRIISERGEGEREREWEWEGDMVTFETLRITF